MNETDFQKKLRNILDSEYNCDIDKIHGNMYQAGLPDLIGVAGSYPLGKGRAIYIECKVLLMPKKPDSLVDINISALQIHTLQQKRAKGAIALVACYVEMPKSNKKVCVFFPPTNELKDPKYKLSKQVLMEHIIKCMNGRAIGVSANKIIYL